MKNLLALLLLITAGLMSIDRSAEAAPLKEIRQRGKLIVGVKDNLPPLGYRDRSNNFQGLEIEIARKLAAEIFQNKPHTIEFVPLLNQDRLRSVLEGKVDLTIARLTITPTRSRVIDFSRSYYTDGTQLLVKAGQVKNTTQLNSKSIAVLTNSSTISTLQYILPKANLVGVDSYDRAVELLESNGVAAVAADYTSLYGIGAGNSKYRILPQRLSSEYLGVALPKGLQFDELKQLVDRSIQTWKTNGWLGERIKYWKL
jgi:polar amino acid transport system substrate-binding protein